MGGTRRGIAQGQIRARHEDSPKGGEFRAWHGFAADTQLGIFRGCLRVCAKNAARQSCTIPWAPITDPLIVPFAVPIGLALLLVGPVAAREQATAKSAPIFSCYTNNVTEVDPQSYFLS